VSNHKYVWNKRGHGPWSNGVHDVRWGDPWRRPLVAAISKETSLPRCNRTGFASTEFSANPCIYRVKCQTPFRWGRTGRWHQRRCSRNDRSCNPRSSGRNQTSGYRTVELTGRIDIGPGPDRIVRTRIVVKLRCPRNTRRTNPSNRSRSRIPPALGGWVKIRI